MAHEIGHLLLDSNSHSGAGIVQPHWDPEQMRLLLMGALLFVPEQSKLMRAEARRRMGNQMLGLKEQSIVAAD
jgi:hypothetical protein